MLIKHGFKDMAKEVAEMRNILIPAGLVIVVLTACLASGALSSPNLDISQMSALTKAGTFASPSAPSINVEAIDIGQAASGNSNPVNITVNVTNFFSDSNQAEAICGLDRFNFEIDTIEVPPDGTAVRIMSVSPTYANFMYAPAACSYWISIIPITNYLNQGSPANPSPGKQNTWENGAYTLRLKYMNGGYETASKPFSFTIGVSASLGEVAEFNKIIAIGSKRSPLNVDPINQLNPQPEPPIPPNPSFLGEKGTQEA
jgi:hypothetical protein